MAKEMTCGDCKYFGKKSCPFVTEDLEPDEETCEEFKKSKKEKKGKGKKDLEEKKGKKGKKGKKDKDPEEKKGKKGKKGKKDKDPEEKKGKKGKKGKITEFEKGCFYKVDGDEIKVMRVSGNGNARVYSSNEEGMITVNPEDCDSIKEINEYSGGKKEKKGGNKKEEKEVTKKKKGGKKDGEEIANVLEALFKGKFGGKNRGPYNISKDQFADISGYKKVKDDLLDDVKTELLNLNYALIDVPEEDILVVIEAKKFASLRSPSKKEWTKLSKTF